jgi:hypothetical protein
MGDYVNRGFHWLHTFLCLMYLKLEFLGRIHLLCGSYETRLISN